MLFDTYDNSVFVQLHGFGKRTNDPYLIVSNGTRVTPTVDYISLIEQELFKIDPSLTFKIAHINQDWSRLIAFTNTDPVFAADLVNYKISLLEEWFLKEGVTVQSKHLSMMEDKLEELSLYIETRTNS